MEDKRRENIGFQRICSLLDENSFIEFGEEVTARNTDFSLQERSEPGDGVITGYGTIEGRLVYIYSQDASVFKGAMGEMQGRKILSLYQKAIQTSYPIIGMIDCEGLRLQEDMDGLAAFGEIYQKQALASGKIPQITAIFGSCGGGLSVLAGMTDFVFMEKKGRLFLHTPNTIEGSRKELLDTGTGEYRSQVTGSVDVLSEEPEIYQDIRALVGFLPENYSTPRDRIEFQPSSEELNRRCEGLEVVAEDVAWVIREVGDYGQFFEIKKEYAKEMVVGFLRMDGVTVGAFGNRSKIISQKGEVLETYQEELTSDGLEKASEFVRFCDAFQIPILSFTNILRFKSEVKEEKSLPKMATRLVYELANATVPKVNIILKKAFGTPYLIMNSKSLGADICLSWETAQVGVLDAKITAQIIGNHLSGEERTAIEKEFSLRQKNGFAATKRGYIDKRISPEDTRRYILGALEMLWNKDEQKPRKRHGAK